MVDKLITVTKIKKKNLNNTKTLPYCFNTIIRHTNIFQNDNSIE